MSHRNTVKKTYLTDEEAAQLSEWADEVGKSESHLIREAILEYLDRDRTARLEERLARIEDKLDAVTPASEAEGTHTHKPTPGMSQGTTAIEKAREIIHRLQANHKEVIKTADVERAIEDIAGIDDRTIAKYKDIFRKRGLLFEHPAEPPTWTTDANLWLDWIEDYASLNGTAEAEQVVEEYPVEVGPRGDGLDIILTDRAEAEVGEDA